MVSQFARGVSAKGYEGVGGATEFALAQAAGYEPGQGTDAYFKALHKMQNVSENPALMTSYLKRFLLPGEQAGSSTETAMIQRALQAVNVKVHADSARSLAAGLRAGRGATALANLPGLTAQGVHGDLRVEASLEAERADAGRKLAKTMQSLSRTTIELMKVVAKLSPALEGAAAVLEGVAITAGKLAEGLVAFVESLWEIVEYILDWIT